MTTIKRTHMNRAWTVTLLGLWLIGGLRPGLAEDGDGGASGLPTPSERIQAERANAEAFLAGRVEAMTADLNEVSKAFEAAVQAAANMNREFLQFEHDIVYSNKTVNAVYQEVKTLEKQLLDKRTELREQVMKLPEMREMMKQRQALFERQRELGERQQQLRAELAELQSKIRPVSAPAVDEGRAPAER